MGMKGFSDEFQSPEHYIIDITYRIWEERGLDLIRDWYSDDCPVKTPMSFSVGVDPVIRELRRRWMSSPTVICWRTM